MIFKSAGYVWAWFYDGSLNEAGQMQSTMEPFRPTNYRKYFLRTRGCCSLLHCEPAADQGNQPFTQWPRDQKSTDQKQLKWQQMGGGSSGCKFQRCCQHQHLTAKCFLIPFLASAAGPSPDFTRRAMMSTLQWARTLTCSYELCPLTAWRPVRGFRQVPGLRLMLPPAQPLWSVVFMPPLLGLNVDFIAFF